MSGSAAGDNPDPTLGSDHWCTTTEGDTLVTTFTWKIENFASLSEKLGEAICSSTFSAKKPNSEDSMWQLVLYPNGKDDEDNDFVLIYLWSKNDFPVKVKFQGSIIDSSLKKIRPSYDNLIDFGVSNMEINYAWLVLREVVLKDPQLLPGGHLTIHCELTVHGTRKTLSGSKHLEDESNFRVRGLEQVCSQLGKLFTEKEFADVEIECDGDIFHCHQLILSTRSDVFRAMFRNDMTENRTKKSPSKISIPRSLAKC